MGRRTSEGKWPWKVEGNIGLPSAELQAVSCLTMNKPRSSARAVFVLNHRAISPGPPLNSSKSLAHFYGSAKYSEDRLAPSTAWLPKYSPRIGSLDCGSSEGRNQSG